MSPTWGELSRATGIVATVLLIAALVGGFFFSARNTGRRRSPAWWLDLHNWLGGLALVMIGLHLVTVYLDRNSGVGLVKLVVPGTTGWPLSWGVLATYPVALAVATSWPRKRLRPVGWRVVHLGSVVGTVLAGVHAYQAGSDAAAVVLQVSLACLAALAIYAGAVRGLSKVLPEPRKSSQQIHR